MPMSEKNEAGETLDHGMLLSDLLGDERLRDMLSAFIDDRLEGAELEEFQQLLNDNETLAREVKSMRGVEEQLKLLGAEVLDEPIPEALLEAVRRGFKE